MEHLGSAKWLEIFERFPDLKKVEKHCSIGTVRQAIYDNYRLTILIYFDRAFMNVPQESLFNPA